MVCLSTERVIADDRTCAMNGRVAWSPARSLWTGGMTLAALVAGPMCVTPSSVALFVVTSAVTLCLGHSLGLHRLLIHRSFQARPWLGRTLIYLGVLVGMAGPLGMVRLHDMRDWAQRQSACHDFHAHRAPFLHDAWRQLHCRLVLDRRRALRSSRGWRPTGSSASWSAPGCCSSSPGRSLSSPSAAGRGWCGECRCGSPCR